MSTADTDPVPDLPRHWHRPGTAGGVEVRVVAVGPAATAFSLRGDLDQPDVDAVLPLLLRLIAGSSGTDRDTVVVDLSGVGFFGSAGWELLVRAALAAAAESVSLRGVRGDQPTIGRVLRITGLTGIVPWFPTVEDAARRVR